MTTTSLKLPDDLKNARPMSPGSWAFRLMPSWLPPSSRRPLPQSDARLLAEAKVARHEMIETGKGFEADAVHAYLGAKAAGKPASKPKARTWRG